MSTHHDAPRRCLHRSAASLLLFLTGCAQLPTTSSAVIPPVPAGAARIWIYRNDGPYEAHQTPYVWLNGRIAAVIQPNGAFYCDAAPGNYTVTVDSYGVPYPHQFAEFNLGAGQEPFVKVLSMRERVGDGENRASRTFFFSQLFPADAARPAVAGTPFYGSL
jgi:hypothetical protein